MTSKRDEALLLAEQLLGDIELQRLEALDIARKASRLCRLTDDNEAAAWLYYEIVGYPEGGKTLDAKAWAAAERSNRTYLHKDGVRRARTAGLGEVQTNIESASIQISASIDAPNNASNGGVYPTYQTQHGNGAERSKLRQDMILNKKIMDRVVGSIHIYVTAKYQELRFGAAVESAFQNVRSGVDSKIGKVVPNALPILTTALENADSDNPVQWNNAAKACRDLIKAAADELRPPGDPVDGRKMDDANYINRLVNWIEQKTSSKTMQNIISSDLHDLGKRIDAVTDGGHKASHPTKKSAITKEQASRFIVGTYIVLGDVLSLVPEGELVIESAEPIDRDDTAETTVKEQSQTDTAGSDAKPKKPQKKSNSKKKN